MKRRAKGWLVATVLFCLWTQFASAGDDEVMPDIDLLEFLGTIAGLENMGVEIDELLAGSEADEVSDTVGDTEASEGDSNE